MIVLCLYMCSLCVPNIMSLGMFLKIPPHQTRLLDTTSKFVLFSLSGSKDEKLIKSKPTWKLKMQTLF